MAVPDDFLSDEQVARYGRFAAEPTAGELEVLFRLTTQARELAAAKRQPETRLGWAVANPPATRAGLVGLLRVPEGRRVSELERLRTPPTRVSGRAMDQALDRVAEIGALGASSVDVSPVHAARLAGLARYGMAAKAPSLAELEVTRQTATLLATVRHLTVSSVDDALDLLDLLMASRLLPRAQRADQQEKLRTLPRGRRAARTLAAAVQVLIGTSPATETGELVSVAEAWTAIEQVTSREQLTAAVARDGDPKPEIVVADTASYSDIVFGLFAICGYQFAPRIADLPDTRLWRANPAADYGPLQQASRHLIRPGRIRAHWPDMLRVAGSLTLGEVRGYDLIRMLSRDGRPTGATPSPTTGGPSRPCTSCGSSPTSPTGGCSQPS